MGNISVYLSGATLWILILIGIYHHPLIGILYGLSTLWLAYIIKKETDDG